MRTFALPFLLALFTANLIPAHQQPTTLVVLDVGSDHVTVTLHVPLTELELAFGHQVTQSPKKTIATWRPAFEQYLLNHIHPGSTAGHR